MKTAARSRLQSAALVLRPTFSEVICSAHLGLSPWAPLPYLRPVARTEFGPLDASSAPKQASQYCCTAPTVVSAILFPDFTDDARLELLLTLSGRKVRLCCRFSDDHERTVLGLTDA
jgi:hypothetical protein